MPTTWSSRIQLDADTTAARNELLRLRAMRAEKKELLALKEAEQARTESENSGDFLSDDEGKSESATARMASVITGVLILRKALEGLDRRSGELGVIVGRGAQALEKQLCAVTNANHANARAAVRRRISDYFEGTGLESALRFATLVRSAGTAIDSRPSALGIPEIGTLSAEAVDQMLDRLARIERAIANAELLAREIESV